MAQRVRAAIRFARAAQRHSRHPSSSSQLPSRRFHASPPSRTDCVFRALTDDRVCVPWIEALRKQRDAARAQPSADASSEFERDLTPKRMSDSYHRVILPLARDPWLSDTYLNSLGHIRLGTVFMDLDALSGVIAYKHTGDGITTVTAAVDRISVEETPLDDICDLEYSGQVTCVGRSSMEITCKVAKAPPAGLEATESDVLITCAFTMVSLDPQTKRPVNIPSLHLTTPHEHHLFDLGASRSAHKKSLSRASLLTQPLSPAESRLTHRAWLQQLAHHDPNRPSRLPFNAHPMSSTVLTSASIMQPQYRNRHQFQIFGGFLLKATFELAFCCAASFSHERPGFVSADPCTFLNPVPVGSVLYLTATVVYTDPSVIDEEERDEAEGAQDGAIDVKSEGGHNFAASERKSGNRAGKTRISVRVDSKVRDVEHGHARPTGEFHYTFAVERDVRVFPQSYQEHIMLIDGRRRSRRVDAELGRQADGADVRRE